jgi:hypothetical protein
MSQSGRYPGELWTKMLGTFGWDYMLCQLCSDPYGKIIKWHVTSPKNC